MRGAARAVLDGVGLEVEFWDEVYGKAEELERTGYRVRHGGLSRILEEVRGG